MLLMLCLLCKLNTLPLCLPCTAQLWCCMPVPGYQAHMAPVCSGHAAGHGLLHFSLQYCADCQGSAFVPKLRAGCFDRQCVAAAASEHTFGHLSKQLWMRCYSKCFDCADRGIRAKAQCSRPSGCLAYGLCQTKAHRKCKLHCSGQTANLPAARSAMVTNAWLLLFLYQYTSVCCLFGQC
jgi:hypothetical protein